MCGLGCLILDKFINVPKNLFSMMVKGRDCAGSCGGNVILQAGGKSFCVPEADSGNFTLCDGSTDSDAKINECGVCYGGNTGNTANTGIELNK